MTERERNEILEEMEVEEEQYDTITLTLDDDTELECIILGNFSYDGKDYIALLPENEEDGEDVYLYEYREINDEEVELNTIDDDELFERVSQEFEDLFVEDEEDEE